MTLRFRTMPERSFPGVVEEIAPVASELEEHTQTRFVTVRVSILDADAARALRAGTTGYARIELGPRPVHEIAQRWLARVVRLDVWSAFSF